MTATLTSTLTGGLEADVASLLRHELLRLAVEQERIADAEAAQVPYWAPSPASVEGHRAAASGAGDRALGLLRRGPGHPGEAG